MVARWAEFGLGGRWVLWPPRMLFHPGPQTSANLTVATRTRRSLRIDSIDLNADAGLDRKEAVVNHHREVPYHLLQMRRDLSVGDPGSGNLLVQGDNLLALKALLPYYAGRVKCIYIDPPYNTGNEKWVYNDNVNSPEIRKWLGKVVGKEAEDLSRHDKWLCMMYPRLVDLAAVSPTDGSDLRQHRRKRSRQFAVADGRSFRSTATRWARSFGSGEFSAMRGTPLLDRP